MFLTSIRSTLGTSNTTSPHEVLSQIAALKTKSVSCKEEVATREQQLAARSKELQATQLCIASLKAQVIGFQEANNRLRETGLQC